MKKITVIFLLCCAGVLHAVTYNGTCGANLKWSLNTSKGDLLITGSGDMRTYSSSSHAPWYNYRKKIRRVLMNDSITSVGDYAFDGCTYLRYIYFPVELTSGGRMAVTGCSSLKEVYWNARHLTSYYGPLNQASSVEKIIYGDSVRVIENAAVPYAGPLRRIEFGQNITQISSTAFSFCDAADTIVWNVRRYTVSVSYGLQAPLRCLIIGDSVRYLGRLTAANSNAHILRIPFNVDTILSSAFGGSSYSGKLDTVIWGARAPHIIHDNFQNNRLFEGNISRIRAFIFEEGVEHIPEGLCASMSNVENIHLPSTVESIGRWAFANMSNLKRVNIPYSLRSADCTMFNNCSGLQHIRWEAADCHLGEDGSSPFSVRIVDNLQTWTFGDSVRVIPAKLCQRETTIKEIRIPASVDSIGQDAFLYCQAMERIVVDEENIRYDSREDCNAIIYTASDSLVCGAQYTRIPESVKYIAPNAFRRLNHLNWAELKNPDVQIGDRAFADVAQIDSIYWNVRTMQSTPFYSLYEGSLFTVTYNTINPNVQYCLFGDSVQHIPAEFCKEMRLQEIHLPYALQSIGNNAFYGCNTLQNIYCAGVTPAEGYASFPSTIQESATVHVPCGAGSTYRAHAVWGLFANIVEEAEDGQPCIPDGFKQTINDPSHEAKKIINNGQIFILRGNKTYTATGQETK